MTENWNNIKKLYCPLCGEEMIADIHGEPLTYVDNWICNSGGRLECRVLHGSVVFDRDDIKGWF